MAKDFNNFGHKNAELLRHYIVREIKGIDKKITDNSSELAGYFIASFVDVLVVMVFDDFLEKTSICYRILIAAILIVAFYIMSKFISYLLAKRHVNFLIEGKQKFDRDNIEKYIDEFDNIACDGLLICQNYMNKYLNDKKCFIEVKEFYFYEIVHHLKKSINSFERVYGKDRSLYIRKNKGDELYKIDSYRIENFIKISQKICDFLETESKNNTKFQDALLTNDIASISTKLEELNK